MVETVKITGTGFDWMNEQAARRECEARARLDAAVRDYQAALDRRYSVRLSVRVRERVPQVFRQLVQFLGCRGGNHG